MLSVASCSGVGRQIRKRKNNGRDKNADSCGTKMPKTGFYFVLESESDVTSSSGEDTESILSIQNQSTDFAKDTSDTSSKAGSSDYDNLIGLEFEVMSLPENEQHSDSYSSGSDWAIRRVQTEDSEGEDRAEDKSMWADDSSGASEQIISNSAQLLPSRPRTCSKCKAQTNFFQFCHHCYKARKNFFPPRPKGNSKKNTLKSSFKRKIGIKEPTNAPLSSSKTDSCLESSSSQELILTPSDFNKTGGSSNAEGLCNICLVNPKNGAFLHCRWVHIYSCYQCSLKVLLTNKCCPVCNGKIRQVSKVAIC